MFWQYIAVGLIVLAAALFLLRRAILMRRNSTCAHECGCGHATTIEAHDQAGVTSITISAKRTTPQIQSHPEPAP
ncbi:MAG: FeoB-associated Cys-rich membrane protein [Phycisphaerae bacterium]|nr:FeoB-associated Cys-rich membrane protein [Phycisphaerae bacterium]